MTLKNAMPTTIKPTTIIDYIGAVVLLILFVGAVLIVWNVTRGGKTGTTSSPAYSVIACPKDIRAFKELKEKGQMVKLIPEPKNMYARRGVFVNAETVVTKNETKDSKIACGYLYVKAHTQNGPLASYQDVYINPDNFGGHINSHADNNQFGPGDGNERSEYLFLLDDIKYWKSKNRGDVLNADWASLLNVSPEVTFIIALNAEDPSNSGYMDEVSIVYKCKNPTTGEENFDCKLQATPPKFSESSLP